ncbi:MAG: hypothetical protein Q4C81_09525 [Kocuria sp.]|nr:hypothetical protein [Kocuria sp.]
MALKDHGPDLPGDRIFPDNAPDPEDDTRPGKRTPNPAVMEVRVRRLALALLIVIPLIWWLTRVM